MRDTIQPIARQSLADDLAQRLQELIRNGDYAAGDRLPSIAAMAAEFRVGSPTVREALKTLEAVGIVDIRHGSGVYVTRVDDRLLVTNPMTGMALSKKTLLDVIGARIPIELTTVTLAATNASRHDLDAMAALLDRAAANLDDIDILDETNLAFHRQIAIASGNGVLRQLLETLTSLFTREQRVIMDIKNSRRTDHLEHCGIHHALATNDPELARKRMSVHLEQVRSSLQAWDPELSPVG